MIEKLHASSDRKVSPSSYFQESIGRWVPRIKNSFGLPAGSTCPGQTDFCGSCYAYNAENGKGVSKKLQDNFVALRSADMPSMTTLMTHMLEDYEDRADALGLERKDRIFRIHWDGDFFSVDYAIAWAQAIQYFPEISFWAYTRSFGEPVDVVPILHGIKNLTLYLSVDWGNIEDAKKTITAYPDIPIAYCGDNEIDDDMLRDELERYDRRAIICPENTSRLALVSAVGRGACADCRICIRGRYDVKFVSSHGAQPDAHQPVLPGISEQVVSLSRRPPDYTLQ